MLFLTCFTVYAVGAINACIKLMIVFLPLCRCNINIAFFLQMWRAESLKAGAGSRSKAAKPCPSHPRLSATMLRARGEWALLEREEKWVGGGLGQSGLHGNIKRGVTDVFHPAVHLLPLLLSAVTRKLPPSSLTVPVVPNACSQILTGTRSAWHMDRFTALPVLFLPNFHKKRSSVALLHDVSCAAGCIIHVTGCPFLLSGCLSLLHGFGVAMKSFPFACVSRLLLSLVSCYTLSLLIQFLSFNLPLF